MNNVLEQEWNSYFIRWMKWKKNLYY